MSVLRSWGDGCLVECTEGAARRLARTPGLRVRRTSALAGSRFGTVVRDLATIRELERARDTAAGVSAAAPDGLRVTGGDPMQHIMPSWRQRGAESAPRAAPPARAESHGAGVEACKRELAECRAKLRGLRCHEEMAALRRRVSELEAALARRDDDLPGDGGRSGTPRVADGHDTERDMTHEEAAAQLIADKRREKRRAGPFQTFNKASASAVATRGNNGLLGSRPGTLEADHDTGRDADVSVQVVGRGMPAQARGKESNDAEEHGRVLVVPAPIARAIAAPIARAIAAIDTMDQTTNEVGAQRHIVRWMLSTIAETNIDGSPGHLAAIGNHLRALLAAADGKPLGALTGQGEVHVTLRAVLGDVRAELIDLRSRVMGHSAGVILSHVRALVAPEDLASLMPVLDDLLNDKLDLDDRTGALGIIRSLNEKYKSSPDVGFAMRVLLLLAGERPETQGQLRARERAKAPPVPCTPPDVLSHTGAMGTPYLGHAFGAIDDRPHAPPWPDALLAELAKAVARRRQRLRFGHGRHV
jgi:hypothetical protein